MATTTNRGRRGAGRLAPLGLGGVGVGVGGTGALAWFHPLAGGIVVCSVVALVVVILLTAVFGRDDQRANAFRLLRWFRGMEEPPAPTL